MLVEAQNKGAEAAQQPTSKSHPDGQKQIKQPTAEIQIENLADREALVALGLIEAIDNPYIW